MKEKFKRSIDQIKQSNQSLREEITERISFQNDNIASVKSDIDRSLTIFGLIIAFVLFVAGYIVNGYLKETQKLTDEAKTLLSQTKDIEDTVKKIKNEINNDTTELYKRLQKEEIDSIFKKLEENPNDIGFYFFKLTRSSVVINSEYYAKLRNMYPNVGEKSRDFYQGLMFHISPVNAITETDLFANSSLDTPNYGAINLMSNNNDARIINKIFKNLAYDKIIESENIGFLIKLLSGCMSAPIADCNYTNRIHSLVENLNRKDFQSLKLFFKNKLPSDNGFIHALNQVKK